MSRVDTWKFPGGPVIRIQLWLWIIPLVKELRSCKPCSMAKKKKKKKELLLKHVDGKWKDPAALCPSHGSKRWRGLIPPHPWAGCSEERVGSVSRPRGTVLLTQHSTPRSVTYKLPHACVICLQGFFVMTKIGKWLSTWWDSKQPERRLGFLDGKMINVYCEAEEARCGKCTERGVCVSVYLWVYLAGVCIVMEVRQDHSHS